MHRFFYIKSKGKTVITDFIIYFFSMHLNFTEKLKSKSVKVVSICSASFSKYCSTWNCMFDLCTVVYLLRALNRY